MSFCKKSNLLCDYQIFTAKQVLQFPRHCDIKNFFFYTFLKIGNWVYSLAKKAGSMVQASNRYNLTSYWPTDQQRIGYGFAINRQAVTKKNDSNPARSLIQARPVDMDRALRLRISRLERRVDSLNSTFKICFFALGTIGLGTAAYYNWDSIKGAVNGAWNKMYTWEEIEKGGRGAWVWVSAFFSNEKSGGSGGSGGSGETPPL